MKSIKAKGFRIFILAISLFVCAVSMAEYKPVVKQYSVIGDNKKEIYEQFDEYNMFKNIDAIEPSGAIISEEYISSEPEESLPESVQEIAGQELLDYLDLDKTDNMKYSSQNWQKKNIRRLDIAQSTSTIQILPPSLRSHLPFESQLSLSGRKLIGFDYTSRVYDKEEDGKRKNTSFFKMEQELQMRVLGSVGDRLNVNVDYDDKAGKKDISLVYKGQPGEFVQEAAFGDISVSLPTTEFTGYSKELFGLKVNTRYKSLGVNAFFSKTKGLSEIKRFTGNTQLERRTIADTSYVKLKYYSLLKNGAVHSIRSGTAKIYVAYQKLDPKRNFSITSDKLLNGLNNTGFSYGGNFVLLVAGQDYNIDYNTGVLAFKTALAKGDVVAVNYEFTDGTPLSSAPLIIKDINNTANITTELKTCYELGNLKIIRDDGRGNFLLEIKDLNNDTPQNINGDANKVPAYPNKPGYAANITVDFENGVFRLGELLHDSLYSANDHKYNFITEYQYTVKILMLRPGIVPQSEKIVIDGVTKKSGTDYILDYDAGILTIKDENSIKENSTLDVSYDYTLLGAEAESTLVGASSRFDLTNNISVGASIIHNFMSKGTVLPDIKNVPTSLTVGESDVKIKDLDIDALNMKINADAEYALSTQNINTSDKALIDSMDSSTREDVASMLEDNWFHSAAVDENKHVTQRNLSDLSWKSYEIYLRDIDPDLEFTEGQKQLVLELNYDVTYRKQIAFAQKLCQAWEGQDYSKKLYVDIWILDNNLSSHEFVIDYALCINEDADGNGLLDTEDTEGTGILSPWQDTGQKFHNADGTISLIGAHNGKLDTEDINGNGVLDTREDVADPLSLKGADATVIKENNANGWKQIRIPLKITEEKRTTWKNIRILRIRVKQKEDNNTGDRGKIIIGKIAIVGNKWEKIGPNTDKFSISSIGKFDPTYKSLLTNRYYLDLYGIESSIKKDEQALKVSYNNIETLAKSVYTGEPLDISRYDSIRFMVYAKYASVGDVIIFRAGGSDTNYFECKVTVTNDPSWNDWKLITINQNGAGMLASWSTSDESAEISVAGNPSLDRISQFVIGVTPSSAAAGTDHQVWFNEIHVVGSKSINGAAWKAGGNLQWNGTRLVGAITAGASKKSIDKNFQTITAGVYNRDSSEDEAFFNFAGIKANRVNILPLKTGMSRMETITPSVAENKSNLVSLNEEGRVLKYTGYAETNLNFGIDLPQLSAKYMRSITDTSKIKRLEDKETLSGTMIYDNPLKVIILPSNITADARTTNSYYKLYPSSPIASSESFLGIDKIKDYLAITQYHTLEQSNMFSLKLPFKFSQGITFSPAYVINTVREKNNDFAQQEIEYDKKLDQTAGANLVLGLVNWFSPTFIYSINTKENYDITSSTDVATLLLPGQKKYIERNGVGEISWNLNAYDITSSPFFKSLTFSTYYRLQDSDSYDRVNKNFQSIGLALDKLWVRHNLLMDQMPSYSTSSYVVKTISNRDDVRFSGRYMPFEAFSFDGHLLPLNTVSVNCAYNEVSESSNNGGTLKDIYSKVWPDMIIGISCVEKFFNQIQWMGDTQLNVKYVNKTVTTYGASYLDSIKHGVDYRFKFLKMFDLYLFFERTNSCESQYDTLQTLSDGLETKYICQGAFDLGKWRMSLRYENEERWQKNALGKYASNVRKNGYSGQINSDIICPSGIRIPIIGKVLPLRNRIIFISNLKYIDQKSEVNVEKDNNANYGAATNVDYEISKYFRFLLGINWDRFEYYYNKDLNYYDISFVSKLTLQF